VSPARRGAAAALVAAALALGSADGAPAAGWDAGSPLPSGPSRSEAWTARLVYPTVARSAPRRDARATGRVGTVAAWDGGPVAYLVLGSRRDRAGELWLRVQLPERPNGRSAWIDADFARLRRTPWRLVIDRAHRRATAYRAGRRARSWRVVVGKPSTPTPRGLFAVYERVRQPAGSELGPFALQLTAHSNTLFNYGGGPGRVALHGRSGPLLSDPLGSARSHGCIRMQNRIIRWLARRALPGTPVEIR
jgi:hypothetical protein